MKTYYLILYTCILLCSGCGQNEEESIYLAVPEDSCVNEKYAEQHRDGRCEPFLYVNEYGFLSDPEIEGLESMGSE